MECADGGEGEPRRAVDPSRIAYCGAQCKSALGGAGSSNGQTGFVPDDPGCRLPRDAYPAPWRLVLRVSTH